MLPASSRFTQAVAPEEALPSPDVLLAAIELDLRCLGWDGEGERPDPLRAGGSAAAEPPTEERMREVARQLGIEVGMDG